MKAVQGINLIKSTRWQWIWWPLDCRQIFVSLYKVYPCERKDGFNCNNKVKNHQSSSRALGIHFVFADVTHSCWNNTPWFFIGNLWRSKKEHFFHFENLNMGEEQPELVAVQGVYGSVVCSLHCTFHIWLLPSTVFCWNRILVLFPIKYKK